jgi:transcriptional regulator with XRE-family HTH domain
MENLFSKNLRFLRKKGNHNQDEISSLFNKRANTVGNWENRKSEPSIQELMKLAVFFNISIQNLLHADLEKQSFIGSVEDPLAASVQHLHSPVLEESLPGGGNGGSQDAFWLILRELRAMHDKVDFLVTTMKSDPHKKNSDKSYH